MFSVSQSEYDSTTITVVWQDVHQRTQKVRRVHVSVYSFDRVHGSLKYEGSY